ncbi:hypothetical protein CEP53_003012 [Fusarium sp. AF-6]|nr:hypothetical protein CEP53_003012 [Fusarium sp. AF-6]
MDPSSYLSLLSPSSSTAKPRKWTGIRLRKPDAIILVQAANGTTADDANNTAKDLKDSTDHQFEDMQTKISLFRGQFQDLKPCNCKEAESRLTRTVMVTTVQAKCLKCHLTII